VERAPLLFAFDDQAHRDALDAAGAEPGLNLLPQDRRDHVPVETVDDPAALLRVDQLQVDVARVLDCAADRLLGDLVELDPPDGHLRIQDLAQVPADRFAFPVGVRGQEHFACVPHGGAQVTDPARLVAGDDVIRSEAVVDIDAHPAPRLVLDACGDLARVVGQVPDVADAGLDAIPVTEQTRERPRLGRRFDDEKRLTRGHRSSVTGRMGRTSRPHPPRFPVLPRSGPPSRRFRARSASGRKPYLISRTAR
jgi:hypothetical protein